MDLIKVVDSVQNISEAISSVIKVDVTIVDSRLIRIAGTGRYKAHIGKTVNKSSVFGYALRQGESFIIENPRQHSVCLDCERIADCQEFAEVCCPIKVDGETIGVIGLVAFEEAQRAEIIENQSNLMNFLNRMAELISSKVLEQENTERVQLLVKEMEIVLNSVDKGMIAVDSRGNILRYNKNALQLFHLDEETTIHMNIQDLIGKFELGALIENSTEIRNKEFIYNKNQYRIRGFFDAKPICIGDKSSGIVFAFSHISDVLNIVNHISTGAIETSLEDIIGNSQSLNSVKLEAAKAAKSASTVLIQGESGTGKELFARAIHFHSSRRKGPFIPVNCAAIPEQLLESELFGYAEGAFTGAKKAGRAGKFELANKGTIFLDEIGDMQLHLQAKLLRVLQERVIEKVGGKESIPIDVRVIAATNKELEKKVLEGEFRQDLFYRLNVIPLNIPSLRERKEDVALLVQYLLEKCNRKLDKHILQVDPCALDILMAYKWPGNVRELENTIEYAVNMCIGSSISACDLPNRLRANDEMVAPTAVERIIPIGSLEKCEIEKAIMLYGKTKQAVTKAADALGISRATLYRKIKEYDIR